jgi:hypothetical protein
LFIKFALLLGSNEKLARVLATFLFRLNSPEYNNTGCFLGCFIRRVSMYEPQAKAKSVNHDEIGVAKFLLPLAAAQDPAGVTSVSGHRPCTLSATPIHT